MKTTNTLPRLCFLIAIQCFVLQIAQLSGQNQPPDGTIIKKVLDTSIAGNNLLRVNAWQPWQKGYRKQGDVFLCDNGTQTRVQRGMTQTILLNQTRPEPILAVAWSKAQNVGGSKNSDYSLYLDLVYTDGKPLWGQVDAFSIGTHDWEKGKVVIFPTKPVKSVSFHLLLRNHSGKAWFRNPELRVLRPPKNTSLFDGVPVMLTGKASDGFQIRDVVANSDFLVIKRQAMGIRLQYHKQKIPHATLYDVTISESAGRDRALTLLFSLDAPSQNTLWLQDPRRWERVQKGREYLDASRFSVGANGRLSRYPFAALITGDRGIGLGIDMSQPAFYRIGYNTDAEELFLAYDIALAPEKPTAHVRFCKFDFKPEWRFRAALARYYEIFPAAFVCRIPEQGLWMPFARISRVQEWQDFGFRFKEGTNEIKWDDAHGIITFRYTEPMTWWMSMAKDLPRTPKAALQEALRLAREQANRQAQALLTSGFYDETGHLELLLRNEPWCNGAVWSMNSMPNIHGKVTDFKNKWNAALRDKLYGNTSNGILDGEYIDSSEGYVTAELDFRRGHLAAAQTPLCFSLADRKPALFRGLIAYEYIRAIADDIHAMKKYMMANATPINLCWFAPLLDVMGTETNWNPGGKWRPMSDSNLLYRRAMCKGKPYCFLMNTDFNLFSHELVERYMKRCLAYGMFPGFFSHNASEGHYFTQPDLYNRDRNLFKKYVPLCKTVAQAGWEPITNALSSDSRVYIERFGDNYLTLLNDSPVTRTITLTLQFPAPAASRELVQQKTITWKNNRGNLTLEAADVALIKIR